MNELLYSHDDCTTEYAPELIMTRLGITIPSLRSLTVLDIGCGSKAGFVKYLRNNGVNAFGFDRVLSAPTPEAYLAQADSVELPDFDTQFDIALSHFSAFRWGCSFFVESGIQRGVLTKKDYERNLTHMGLSVLNLREHMKPRGKLVIFPHPNELLPMLSQTSYEIEKVPEYENNALPPEVLGVDFNEFPELRQRLILHMP